MPPLPRNLHVVTTSRGPDNAIGKKDGTQHNTTRLKCCACHAKWRWRWPKCCACHEKCNASSENVSKVLRLPRKTTFETSWNMLEYVGMSQSATPATRNEAMRSWKCPKVTPFRTYHRHGHSDLARTVADGCERLRTAADGCERLRNVWRTQLNPHTPKVKREPLLRIREKCQLVCKSHV